MKLSDRGVTKGYIELQQATSGNKAIDVFPSMIYNKEQADTSRLQSRGVLITRRSQVRILPLLFI